MCQNAYQSALNDDTPERDLALKKTQMDSLLNHFREHFEDPRHNNGSYRACSLLVFITMALFAGGYPELAFLAVAKMPSK